MRQASAAPSCLFLLQTPTLYIQSRSTTYHTCNLGNILNPQAFAVPLQAVEVDTNKTCSTEWLCRLDKVGPTKYWAGPGPLLWEEGSLCVARFMDHPPIGPVGSAASAFIKHLLCT